MAVTIQNTNYSGEVLEKLLTVAATGNDLVAKGLIHVEPGINKKWFIPRLKTGTMLQKRKENPVVSDASGTFTYSERALEPKDFMAFTTFNPRTFESIWRKWQPKGQLVFRELPPEGQNALLDALSQQVTFELGKHYVNGIYASEGDDKLFNGVVTRILSDSEVIYATTSETTMIKQLQALVDAIPEKMREDKNLKILLSMKDADKYDAELKSQSYKGADWVDSNPMRFGGIPLVRVSNWPTGLLIATLCSPGYDSNLFAAVNLQDDENVIQIDKVSPMSELYFFKMLMMADTGTAFGEECVVLDKRTTKTATLASSVITIPGYANAITDTPAADATYTITGDGVELGASLTVTNSSTSHKITIGTVEIAKSTTVTLHYNGTSWFKVY